MTLQTDGKARGLMLVRYLNLKYMVCSIKKFNTVIIILNFLLLCCVLTVFYFSFSYLFKSQMCMNCLAMGILPFCHPCRWAFQLLSEKGNFCFPSSCCVFVTEYKLEFYMEKNLKCNIILFFDLSTCAKFHL
jgi:hypothetical protein